MSSCNNRFLRLRYCDCSPDHSLAATAVSPAVLRGRDGTVNQLSQICILKNTLMREPRDRSATTTPLIASVGGRDGMVFLLSQFAHHQDV